MIFVAEDRDKRIEQLLEMVGLTQTRSRAVGEFSKGMQRRIGLAQALINDPDLVILDEPTSGLDPIGCREVKDLIVALARRGKTVILSSHLLADVEDVCDRVVILYGGRVQANGSLHELLAKPDSVRISSPALPRETIERVLEIIRHDVAVDKVRIDTPTQNLESYFLEVVQKARQNAAETSGATSGGNVAAYLRGDEGKATPDKLLARLASPAPEPQKEPIPVMEPAKEVDQSKLAALASVVQPAPEPPKPEAQPAVKTPPADLASANKKLASLLGQSKKKNEG